MIVLVDRLEVIDVCFVVELDPKPGSKFEVMCVVVFGI